MLDRRCERSVLAHGPVGRVEVCSCGMVHVCVGPVTLRLEPGAVAPLVRMLAEGHEALMHRDDDGHGTVTAERRMDD